MVWPIIGANLKAPKKMSQLNLGATKALCLCLARVQCHSAVKQFSSLLWGVGLSSKAWSVRQDGIFWRISGMRVQHVMSLSALDLYFSHLEITSSREALPSGKGDTG